MAILRKHGQMLPAQARRADTVLRMVHESTPDI